MAGGFCEIWPRMRVFFLLPLLLGALAGCGDQSSASKKLAYPYRVVTTVGMVTDIVRQVAGEKAKVEGIIGEGVDPHLYKPTRNDVAALLGGDAVFYSGLLLEGKMADTLVKVAKRAGTNLLFLEEYVARHGKALRMSSGAQGDDSGK